MRGVNAETGKHLSGIEHVRQSIRDILTTRFGTRVMRRNYGSRLPELIDNPTNPGTMTDLIAESAIAIARWEPRVRVERVIVLAAEPGYVTLEIRGEYLPDNTKFILDVTI